MIAVIADPTRVSDLRIWLLASLYFALNALTQGWVSPTADLDQAQQLVLSQNWNLGYGTQPPLYTWLVNILFAITGPSSIPAAASFAANCWATSMRSPSANTTSRPATASMGLARLDTDWPLA